MGDDTTTIQITTTTWQQLNSRKEGPNETFDDVIQRLMQSSSTDERRQKPSKSASKSEETESDQLVSNAVEAVAASWDDPDERIEARKNAAEAVLAHAIKTDDVVRKGDDIVKTLHEEYYVDGQKKGTWWRQNVRPVLSEYGTFNNGNHGYRVSRDDLPEIA